MKRVAVSKVRMPRSQSMTWVARAQDVFGRHEQLLDGGGHAALEEDRACRLAHRCSSAKFCMLRAPIWSMSAYSATRSTSPAQDLGDHGQAGGFAGLREELQPLLAQTLEGVGRRARLERAAAQDDAPASLARRASSDHLLALHAARARDDDRRSPPTTAAPTFTVLVSP